MHRGEVREKASDASSKGREVTVDSNKKENVWEREGQFSLFIFRFYDYDIKTHIPILLRLEFKMSLTNMIIFTLIIIGMIFFLKIRRKKNLRINHSFVLTLYIVKKKKLMFFISIFNFPPYFIWLSYQFWMLGIYLYSKSL